ncbi:MAG: heparan N-sulfatase, partial [Cyclobacteriaceae bacterium]
RINGKSHFWDLSFGKRATEELYHRTKDPSCLNNLALHPENQNIKESLKEQLFQKLKEEGDPRMIGQGQIFDNYEYANDNTVNFYTRYMNGEKMNTGWVNESDFERNLKNEK